MEITRLPKSSEIALGLIDVAGHVIPVFNIRKRFGLRQRELSLNDQFILAKTEKRKVALVADTVLGVVEYHGAEATETKQIIPQADYVEAVLKLRDGLVLIHDLESFLKSKKAPDKIHSADELSFCPTSCPPACGGCRLFF